MRDEDNKKALLVGSRNIIAAGVDILTSVGAFSGNYLYVHEMIKVG